MAFYGANAPVVAQPIGGSLILSVFLLQSSTMSSHDLKTVSPNHPGREWAEEEHRKEMARIEREKAAADARLQGRLEALAWSANNSTRPHKSQPVPPEREEMSLADSIRALVNSMNRDFTSADISRQLPEANPESIGTTLQRLAKSGEITIESAGAGRRPTLYGAKRK